MRIMKNNMIIDVSKLRGSTIYEDVLKRDFTINNLACSLDAEIIGSIDDIKNGIIKAVYNNAFDTAVSYEDLMALKKELMR